jgi:hypothetical protein
MVLAEGSGGTYLFGSCSMLIYEYNMAVLEVP